MMLGEIMERNLLSVIIPVYNVKNYLDKSSEESEVKLPEI